MKLRIVPAKHGIQWVKQGLRTFWKQPLAFGGLFLLFMMGLSLLQLVPVLGTPLMLAFVPIATLGIMAASAEAERDGATLPSVVQSALQVGRQHLNAMLLLGALYAIGLLLIMGISSLVDGGKFAKFYLMNAGLTPETLTQSDFQIAGLLAIALYVPLSMLFWHAPALVHWHGIAPVKSLFFSFVACTRNFWTFTLYSLGWMGVFLGASLVVAMLTAPFGRPELVMTAMFPTAMVLAAMFLSSIYFTFRDCFDTTSDRIP